MLRQVCLIFFKLLLLTKIRANNTNISTNQNYLEFTLGSEFTSTWSKLTCKDKNKKKIQFEERLKVAGGAEELRQEENSRQLGIISSPPKDKTSRLKAKRLTAVLKGTATPPLDPPTKTYSGLHFHWGRREQESVTPVGRARSIPMSSMSINQLSTVRPVITSCSSLALTSPRCWGNRSFSKKPP